MQKNNIYSSILDLIKTKSDLDKLLAGVRMIKDSLYKVGSYEQALNKEIDAEIDAKVVAMIQKATEGKDIRNFLLELEKRLENFKFLKLTICFEPTPEQLANIMEWVNKNLAQGILLEINYDSSLVGGAIVEFEGKYGDFTIKRKLEEMNVL